MWLVKETSMIAVNNAVYTWGRGDYGQLGRPLTCATDQAPNKLDISTMQGVPRVVSCGSEHTLVLTGMICC